MKEIKTLSELEKIDGKIPSIIKFGLPNCIPCKITQENLESLEQNNKYNLSYYECSNIDIITKMGYSNVPVIRLYTPSKVVELDDSSISMDIDELSEWINENLN